MDIAPQQRAGTIVFGNESITAVEEPCRVPAAQQLVKPPERVVAQACGLSTAATYEPVLDIIDIGVDAVGGEIAIRIVAVGRARDCAVLVKAVRGVATVDVNRPIPRVRVIVACAARDLR